MRQLMDFYEYKGKLLYSTRNFLGYDPIFSIPLQTPPAPKTGQEQFSHGFIIRDETFHVTLTAGMFYCLARRYLEVDVKRNEKLIISARIGSRYLYTDKYLTGPNYFIDADRAYLIVDGYTMKDVKYNSIYRDLDPENYYLLIFERICKPIKYPEYYLSRLTEQNPYRREHLVDQRRLDGRGAYCCRMHWSQSHIQMF